MKRIVTSIVPTLVVVLAIGTLVHNWWTTPCTVRGRVTVGGQPVPAGSVLVESESIRWGTIAMLSPAGEYEVTDVPPGPVRVGVMSRGVRRSNGDGPLVWTPQRYENPTASGLGLTVRRGVQRYDIDLPTD
jgi:hypothetical protein